MSITENIKVMRDIFSAIERRDERRFLALVHPDVEMHWPSSLPYGGTVTWSAAGNLERHLEPPATDRG